ncbi:MAG: hypothetical protein ACP5OV_07620 [Acidimicrobiales bacterium]
MAPLVWWGGEGLVHIRVRDGTGHPRARAARRSPGFGRVRHGRATALFATVMLILATASTSAPAQSPAPLGSPFAPAATSWLDATTGYVLGEGACAPLQSGCTSILMTRDGGRTFTRWPGPRYPWPLATLRPRWP